MKNTIFSFILLLTASKIFAQELTTPSHEPKLEFMLRGKALGFVFIEDIWARTFSIGTEIRYKKTFSFSADLVHFRWRFEQEQYNDPLDPDNYVEFSQFDARNYGAFEFRFYPLNKITAGLFLPYITVLSKVGGRREMHAQKEFTFEENDVFSMKSSFYDFGSALGFQAGDRLGVDVNIGAAYRTEQKSEVIYHENAGFTYTTDVITYKWSPVIRVNFFWNLSRTFK